MRNEEKDEEHEEEEDVEAKDRQYIYTDYQVSSTDWSTTSVRAKGA